MLIKHILLLLLSRVQLKLNIEPDTSAAHMVQRTLADCGLQDLAIFIMEAGNFILLPPLVWYRI